MGADERRITIALSASLADEMDQAVARGDAGSREEFMANALQHELIRLKDEATDKAFLHFSVADEAVQEDVGIGWEALMLKTDESRKGAWNASSGEDPPPGS